MRESWGYLPCRYPALVVAHLLFFLLVYGLMILKRRCLAQEVCAALFVLGDSKLLPCKSAHVFQRQAVFALGFSYMWSSDPCLQFAYESLEDNSHPSTWSHTSRGLSMDDMVNVVGSPYWNQISSYMDPEFLSEKGGVLFLQNLLATLYTLYMGAQGVGVDPKTIIPTHPGLKLCQMTPPRQPSSGISCCIPYIQQCYG